MHYKMVSAFQKMMSNSIEYLDQSCLGVRLHYSIATCCIHTSDKIIMIVIRKMIAITMIPVNQAFELCPVPLA